MRRAASTHVTCTAQHRSAGSHVSIPRRLWLDGCDAGGLVVGINLGTTHATVDCTMHGLQRPVDDLQRPIQGSCELNRAYKFANLQYGRPVRTQIRTCKRSGPAMPPGGAIGSWGGRVWFDPLKLIPPPSEYSCDARLGYVLCWWDTGEAVGGKRGLGRCFASEASPSELSCGEMPG